MRQILGLPADPSEGSLPSFETEGLPFTQEFYSVIDPSYGRSASPFPYEPRPDPMRASLMKCVRLGCLLQLLQFEAHFGVHNGSAGLPVPVDVDLSFDP